MKQQSTPALAASAIRKELKAAFPAYSFKVTSQRYSGGSSVNVEAQDLSPEQSKIVKSIIDKYQYGSFNGMEDIYEITNNRDDLPQVQYVSYENGISDNMKKKVIAYMQSTLAGFEQLTFENVNQQKDSFGVWASERLRALFYGRFEGFWR